MRRGEDEGLRLLAIQSLGAHGSPLAREALESGVMEVEPGVLAWTGSTGAVAGHLVVLWLDPELCGRVNEAPSAVDALTAAVAAAVARVSGNALAELKIAARAMTASGSTPYRGRR
ncbi:MAG TPA: hypothetical protein VM925_04730 [Labilithrix sp.]|nr:hypothetical protein [Labilithrix sp.]